ncbi:MAG: dipeptidase [Acidobacteriaceae bacterium]|nr:dipeptidase [Acidobacteriaceae bacterium]
MSNNLDWQDLHFSSLVIDGHADTPQRFVDEGWHFSDALGDGMLNLESARTGGLGAQFFAIWPKPSEWKGRFAHRTLQLLDGVYQQLARHSEDLMLGTCADDIDRAYAERKLCILLGLEGGHAIENSLALLRCYYALGIRYMTLTWANSNEWADSSGDLDDESVTHHGGLTEFGRDVIREMNRLGMMVDVSHVSDATFWDVMRTTQAPIVASHSSARALANSPRNLTDEQLSAMATNDGMVMVNFYPSFLDDCWRDAWDASEDERKALHEAAAAPFRERGEPVPYVTRMRVEREFYRTEFAARCELPGVEMLLDHFDHVAKVAGIDHVGIGSDFDGIGLAPAGMETAAQLPEITRGLVARGYTAEQVKKVLGGNMLRVMRAVEKTAVR